MFCLTNKLTSLNDIKLLNGSPLVLPASNQWTQLLKLFSVFVNQYKWIGQVLQKEHLNSTAWENFFYCQTLSNYRTKGQNRALDSFVCVSPSRQPLTRMKIPMKLLGSTRQPCMVQLMKHFSHCLRVFKRSNLLHTSIMFLYLQKFRSIKTKSLTPSEHHRNCTNRRTQHWDQWSQKFIWTTYSTMQLPTKNKSG